MVYLSETFFILWDDLSNYCDTDKRKKNKREHITKYYLFKKLIMNDYF
jgi:hypothetical protein